MEFPLEGARRRLGVLLIALATSAILIFLAGRVWLANHRLASDQVNMMERGAKLTPGNGAAWDGIGHVLQWNLMDPNLPAAITDYRKAIRDNPRSAHYWMDLASAYDASGEKARARDAFNRAVAVYPDSAEVAFYYGNFLLRQQEFPAAYAQLRRAVQTDPKLLPLTISRAWRATGDVNALLDHVLPPNVNAYLQALGYFASVNQADADIAVWQRLVGLGKMIPLPGTFSFFDELIHEGRANDARRAWIEALAAAGLRDSQPNEASVMWNGDFSHAFVNGGLDWRWKALPGVSIETDPTGGPKHSRAVRFDFNGGNNTNLQWPFEYVPVRPNQSYQFHGYLRTREISTESGIRFSIEDAQDGAVEAMTDNLTGTHRWAAVRADVTTGATTHFLIVRLLRKPSQFFENKLSGTAWIADLSLVPVGAREKQGSP